MSTPSSSPSQPLLPRLIALARKPRFFLPLLAVTTLAFLGLVAHPASPYQLTGGLGRAGAYPPSYPDHVRGGFDSVGSGMGGKNGTFEGGRRKANAVSMKYRTCTVGRGEGQEVGLMADAS